MAFHVAAHGECLATAGMCAVEWLLAGVGVGVDAQAGRPREGLVTGAADISVMILLIRRSTGGREVVVMLMRPRRSHGGDQARSILGADGVSGWCGGGSIRVDDRWRTRVVKWRGGRVGGFYRRCVGGVRRGGRDAGSGRCVGTMRVILRESMV